MTETRRKRGRPIKLMISQLLDEGKESEASKIVQDAVYKAGSVAGAAKILGCSLRMAWRYCERFGILSFYDGSLGGTSSRRKMLDGTAFLRYKKPCL